MSDTQRKAVRADGNSDATNADDYSTTPIMLNADPDEIHQFCRAMFCNITKPGYVQLRAFSDDNENRPMVMPWQAVRLEPENESSIDELASKATTIATRAGLSRSPVVFCPPVVLLDNERKALEENITNGLALTVDLDKGNPAEKLERLISIVGMRPTVGIESGGLLTDNETGESLPKIHAHWRLIEPTETPEEHAQLKRARMLANFIIGGDTSNNPLVHPIRWPGSWHRKAQPRLARITECNIDSEIILSDVLAVLEFAAEQMEFDETAAPSNTTADTTRKPESVYLALQDEIRNGESYHEPIVRIAARRIANGSNERAVIDELETLMNASIGPRDERWQSRYSDIARTVRGALKFTPDPESIVDMSQLFDFLTESAPASGWEVVPYGVDIDPDLSHDQLAIDLSRAGFSKDARYVNAWGRWVFWDGTRWLKDEKLMHMTAIRDFVRAKAKKLQEWGDKKAAQMPSEKDQQKLLKWVSENSKMLRQAATISALESVARSNADLVALADQFDADLSMLGTPGGTVDLKTGQLLKPERNHWITKHCAITPADPGTPSPLWSAFLHRVFDGNQELILFLQRAAGYALTGNIGEHKLLFLYGTGRNGKSVFLNTLFDIMAEYSKRAAAQTFLDSHGDRHPTDLAGLVGARLVAGSELPAGKAWNESVIKDLTGSDIISARFMRQDFFEYLPQFTLFIAGNHQPSFRGIDEAIRARVVLIPFTQTIPAEERDPHLPAKLEAEWPAILRWMIDGAVIWYRDGLSVPDSVQKASAEYLDSEDALGEFIEDNLEEAAGGKVTTADMYDRFKSWQVSNGLTQAWTKTAMTKALKERGLSYDKLAGGARGFKGVKLNPPPADDFMDTSRGYYP